MVRSLWLGTAILALAAINPLSAHAQSGGQNVPPPAELHPPINLDADTLRARFATGYVGLKPNATSDVSLPYGINYNRETKGLIVPIDEKNEWRSGC